MTVEWELDSQYEFAGEVEVVKEPGEPAFADIQLGYKLPDDRSCIIRIVAQAGQVKVLQWPDKVVKATDIELKVRNEFHLTVKHDRLSLLVNGQVVADDLVVPNLAEPSSRVIALGTSNPKPGATVRFMDMRFRVPGPARPQR